MKKYFSRGLLASFIIASVFSISSFINVTPAGAQAMNMCQTIDALISAGIIPADKANAAKVAAGCNTPPIVVFSNVPTANIVSSPTLTLSYDNNDKESILTAKFKVSISANATSSDTFIPTKPFGVGMVNASENRSYTVSSGRTITKVVNNNLEETTVDGMDYYIIPSGETAYFDIISTVNPGQLFAGSYFARLYGYWIPYYSQSLKINPLENASYMATVIGETSPYITSVTSPLAVGGRMTVNGVRLNANIKGEKSVVYFDGKLATPLSQAEGDGKTYLSFNLPRLTTGYHNIQLSNESGMSNIVGFEVTDGGNVFEPGCPLILTRDLTVGSSGADVSALQTFLNNNGYNAGKVTGYFGATTKAAILAFQTAKGISPANGFVGPATRAFIAKIDICVPPVVKPSITVLSPNGGENWVLEDAYKIKWSSDIKSGKVGIYLLNVDGLACSIGEADVSLGVYQMALKEGGNCRSNPEFPNFKAGKYKILIDAAPAAGIENLSDKSDSYFNIISKPVTPTPVVSTPVYPACGSAEGISTAVKPEANLCKIGKIGKAGYGDGKWYWACIGSNTGWKDDTAWCFAPKTEATVVTPVVKPEIPATTEMKDCWQSNNAWKISRAWNTPNKDGYWEYDSAVNAQVFYQKEANSDLGTGWRYYKAASCPTVSASTDQSKYGTVNLAWDSFLKLLEVLR